MVMGITDRDLSLMATGYLKRWLERRYDTAMQTPFGEFLHRLDPASKYGLEAALYALTALVDRRLDESTPLGVIVKQVAMDAGPELAKRVLNGEPAAGSAVAPSSQSASGLMAAMLALSAEQLAGILEWLGGLEEQRRQVVTQALGRLPEAALVALAQAAQEHRAALFEILMPTSSSSKDADQTLGELADGMATLRERLRHWRQEEPR